VQKSRGAKLGRAVREGKEGGWLSCIGFLFPVLLSLKVEAYQALKNVEIGVVVRDAKSLKPVR
jgi:hypothetical protein